MPHGDILRFAVVGLLASFPSVSGSGSFHCYFCTSEQWTQSGYCAYFAQCPADSPGCVTVEVTDSNEKIVMKACSFPEKCNDTVASYKKTVNRTVTSCAFCTGDLCNSCPPVPLLRTTAITFPLLLVRILV